MHGLDVEEFSFDEGCEALIYCHYAKDFNYKNMILFAKATFI